ncbi:TPA: hypothetical protein IDY96_003153 [Escherichia coli]|uniref:hypothetical protein n=1 Tax=Escherichia coli TaxID=562 RepID=UPI0019938DE3|nr:hypothetical protein [Escherichia coli]
MLSVFPAPAGINRPEPPSLSAIPGVPRASGDKPVTGVTVKWAACVFPAPAGINRVLQ